MSNLSWKLIAFGALALLTFRELRSPAPASAQSPSKNLYFEPGVTDIPLSQGGNALGKIVVNLDTGETWGFPVFGPKMPYPGIQLSEGTPQVSTPVYLGRFNLQRMNRGGNSGRD